MPKNKTTGEGHSPAQRETWKRFITLSVIGSVLLVLLASSIYFFLQYQKTQSLLNNPSQSQKEQLAFFQKKIGKHYVLPQDSNVTLAAVTDSSRLKSQSFFSQAQNGDQVLIYPDSGLAILYRPSIDKIINVGPVNNESQQASSAAERESQPLKVALYNGTTTVGLTRRAESELKAMSSLQVDVVAKENAGRDDYAESIVVDLSADKAGLTGKNSKAASQLAVYAKGKVGSLPTGETKPDDADILIILGSSFVGEPITTPAPPAE